MNGVPCKTGIAQTGAAMACDGNGNVTDGGQFTYTYDTFNRPSGFQPERGDSAGRRESCASSPSSTTRSGARREGRSSWRS